MIVFTTSSIGAGAKCGCAFSGSTGCPLITIVSLGMFVCSKISVHLYEKYPLRKTNAFFPVHHCLATASIPYVPDPGMMITDAALYASFKLSFKFFMMSQNGFDMWFIDRSVYTTEYSKSPPAASKGNGLAWNGFVQSCWHLGSLDFASSCFDRLAFAEEGCATVGTCCCPTTFAEIIGVIDVAFVPDKAE